MVTADGWAGELGHVVVDPAGPGCGCGATGCLEVIASAAAIEREYAARSPVALAAEDIAVRACRGGPRATAVWARAVAALAQAIVTTVTLTGVDLVLIGGGLAESGDALLEPLRADVASRLTFQRPPRSARRARQPGRLPRCRLPCLGRPVIITVTPNAALDVTYEVDVLTPAYQSHRVAAVPSGRAARESTSPRCWPGSATTWS